MKIEHWHTVLFLPGTTVGRVFGYGSTGRPMAKRWLMFFQAHFSRQHNLPEKIFNHSLICLIHCVWAQVFNEIVFFRWLRLALTSLAPYFSLSNAEVTSAHYNFQL